MAARTRYNRFWTEEDDLLLLELHEAGQHCGAAIAGAGSYWAGAAECARERP